MNTLLYQNLLKAKFECDCLMLKLNMSNYCHKQTMAYSHWLLVKVILILLQFNTLTISLTCQLRSMYFVFCNKWDLWIFIPSKLRPSLPYIHTCLYNESWQGKPFEISAMISKTSKTNPVSILIMFFPVSFPW